MASSASELASLLPRELSALPLLGTGALSEVRLLARPNGLPPLALKATRKPLLAFTQQIDRLVAEHRVLQATCAAECPSSLARFVGALHDAERVYLFSEAVLAHGTQSVDLRQLLDARARLPPATRSLPGAAVARIADGLFGALRHLHGRRFAHRDVKPDNLVISTDGGAVLIDLGHSAALPTDGVSRLRSLVGTEAYMAPELLARRDHGCEVDCWAAGVTLFELLHGEPPFGADECAGWLVRALMEPAAAEERVAQRLGAGSRSDAAALLASCLVVDPTRRADAQTAADDPWLRRFADAQDGAAAALLEAAARAQNGASASVDEEEAAWAKAEKEEVDAQANVLWQRNHERWRLSFEPFGTLLAVERGDADVHR